MKTAMLLITMQLVAVMRIFIVYLGIHAFDAYFNMVNTLFISVYTVLCLAILVTVLLNNYRKFVVKG